MKTILRAALVLLVLCISGCAGLLGPRDVVLPLPRLQQALESRFSYDQRYLALFDVSLSQPRLSARPELNRSNSACDRVLPC